MGIGSDRETREAINRECEALRNLKNSFEQRTKEMKRQSEIYRQNYDIQANKRINYYQNFSRPYELRQSRMNIKTNQEYLRQLQGLDFDRIENNMKYLDDINNIINDY